MFLISTRGKQGAQGGPCVSCNWRGAEVHGKGSCCLASGQPGRPSGGTYRYGRVLRQAWSKMTHCPPRPCCPLPGWWHSGAPLSRGSQTTCCPPGMTLHWSGTGWAPSLASWVCGWWRVVWGFWISWAEGKREERGISGRRKEGQEDGRRERRQKGVGKREEAGEREGRKEGRGKTWLRVWIPLGSFQTPRDMPGVWSDVLSQTETIKKCVLSEANRMGLTLWVTSRLPKQSPPEAEHRFQWCLRRWQEIWAFLLQ